MMLWEVTGVPGTALPLEEFKDHLRLGTGFGDDGVQDALAESYLRAALAAIEGWTGKALIERSFLWELTAWRDGSEQALPLAPVSAIASVTLKDAVGVPQVIAPSAYRLIRDLHRPRIAAVSLGLPTIPTDGTVEIAFTAGFGADWSAVPKDLAQATFLLAAGYHENRHEGGAGRSAGLPQAVMALIERWRTVRVLGGGRA